MGNAHVIGCVLPLGRAIKLRYAFNHSAAIVLYLRTGSSTAAAVSSDFSPQSALKKPSQPEAIAVRLRIMPATRKRHGVWNSISTGSPGPRVRPAWRAMPTRPNSVSAPSRLQAIYSVADHHVNREVNPV